MSLCQYVEVDNLNSEFRIVACTALQNCNEDLMNSDWGGWTLNTIRSLISLCNAYWLVKCEVLDALSKMNYGVINFMEIEYCTRDNSSVTRAAPRIPLQEVSGIFQSILQVGLTLCSFFVGNIEIHSQLLGRRRCPCQNCSITSIFRDCYYIVKDFNNKWTGSRNNHPKSLATTTSRWGKTYLWSSKGSHQISSRSTNGIDSQLQC